MVCPPVMELVGANIQAVQPLGHPPSCHPVQAIGCCSAHTERHVMELVRGNDYA
jgi:hypothetical protein